MFAKGIIGRYGKPGCFFLALYLLFAFGALSHGHPGMDGKNNSFLFSENDLEDAVNQPLAAFEYGLCYLQRAAVFVLVVSPDTQYFFSFGNRAPPA